VRFAHEFENHEFWITKLSPRERFDHSVMVASVFLQITPYMFLSYNYFLTWLFFIGSKKIPMGLYFFLHSHIASLLFFSNTSPQSLSHCPHLSTPLPPQPANPSSRSYPWAHIVTNLMTPSFPNCESRRFTWRCTRMSSSSSWWRRWIYRSPTSWEPQAEGMMTTAAVFPQ
jgi:hypothetical protein